MENIEDSPRKVSFASILSLLKRLVYVVGSDSSYSESRYGCNKLAVE